VNTSAIAGIARRRARKHAGVAIGVDVDGESWTTGLGRLGPDRPQPPAADTIFEIGSITKVFTATVLADMAEEGLVALDDPVQRYLPDDVRLPVRGRPITLVDLATQTSGLPRLPKGLLWRALRESKNPYASFTASDLDRAIRETRPRREPGRKLRYSNYGFGLLGHVLSLRARASYEQLVRGRICAPLGLVDTVIDVPEAKLGRFATGHDRRGRPAPNWDLPSLAGAGALRSTVADLLVFLRAQLDGADTRLARAIRATHEPRMRGRGGVSIGLGWFSMRLKKSGHEVLWHNGGTGGFRSIAGFVPETRTAVVVLSNSSRSVDRLGLEIAEALHA
jgi:D-alanyl-D-alanine-carboxypeptidase/D-alanyl-D-alanine-endopeptidase